jgi:hypothetical protein
MMTHADLPRYGSDSSAAAAPANDDYQPPAKIVTVAELASAMEVDEDTLLQRLAAILSKRKDGNDPAPVGE